MKKEPIDKILDAYFKESSAATTLSNDFDAKVMNKLEAYSPKKVAVEALSGSTLTILFVLTGMIVLASILYFLNPGTLSLSESFNLSVDLSFFQQKAVKYTIYAFAGLMFLTALDKIIQIKTHKAAK